MISTKTAKLINCLPDRLVRAVSNYIMNGYIKKYADISVNGYENLNSIKKPTLFICNHLSNSDAIVLNKVLEDISPTFVAGVKLTGDAVTNLGMKVVKTTPIKPDSPDVAGINNILKLLQQGESVLIFPEGTRSRTGSMIEAKKGIYLIAKKTGAPIVPIGMSGTDKLLPVNKSGNMSKENFQYAKVCVNIGKQFEFPEAKKGQDKKDYVDESITYAMKNIAKLLPEEYRGVYK